jgi:hypothetical protein
MNKFLIALILCCLALSANPQYNSFIAMQENAHGIPTHLLRAVSHVESGRVIGGSVNAWPWTINVEGKGYIFKTKQEAIKAVEKFGLTVKKVSEGLNPHYEVYFSENEKTMCFSKVYNDAVNPQVNFAAIMTCGDAEENCPFIPGVELRIATTYEDPKRSDGTPMQEQTYSERFKQITTEILYTFSLVK